MKFISLVLFISLNTFSQTDLKKEKMKLISFVPETDAYTIFYPENYILNYDGDNTVTMTNPDNGLNITISSYNGNKKLNEEDIIEFLGEYLSDIKKTEWKSLRSKFDNLLEGKIVKKEYNWIWWGVSLEKRIVLLSINKKNEIDEDDYNLLRFIIDNLDINKTE